MRPAAPRPVARRPPAWVYLGVVAWLAACGGEPSAEEERRQLAEDLVAEVGSGLGRDEADCVAGRLQDQFGEDAFRQVLEAADDRSGDAADEVRGTVIDIFATCGALEAVATSDG